MKGSCKSTNYDEATIYQIIQLIKCYNQMKNGLYQGFPNWGTCTPGGTFAI